jgi:hypothetical protein
MCEFPKFCTRKINPRKDIVLAPLAPGLFALSSLTLAFLIRIGGSVVTAPLVGYLRFVLETPRIVGISMLMPSRARIPCVTLPVGVIEVCYQAFEFLERHPGLFFIWRTIV